MFRPDQIAANMTVGGLSSSGLGGVLVTIEKNHDLISLSLVAGAGFIGLVGASFTIYYQHQRHIREKREDQRKEEIYKLKAAKLTTNQGDDNGPIPQTN